MSILVTAGAFAERVVLIRPAEESSPLDEVFNRLQGELRMHGFEAVFASSEGDATFVEMQRIATIAEADACIALELNDGLPTVNLWFIDKLTDSPQSLSFSGSNDAESAIALPLRTVELLRSGILERRETAVIPTTPPPKSKDSVPVRQLKPSKESSEIRRFSARVAVDSTWGTLELSPFLAGEVSLEVRLNKGFALALATTIPLTEPSFQGDGATARYRLYHFGTELRYRQPIVPRRFWLEYTGGLYLTYVRATASAELPLAARHSTGWAATALFGAGAWYGVGSRISIGAMARLGVSVPRPVVEVAERRQTLGRPYATVAVGLGFVF